LKPVQLERLERALERVRGHSADAGRAGRRRMPTHVEEFWVPDHSGLVRIAATDIERVTAERDYMRLHVGPRSWLIHRTIAKLEEDLDPAVFIRVHRSVILRRDTITSLYRDDTGHWTARLKDGGEQRIGRSYVDQVKRLAGR
jgi:two-component system response regulator AlgR